MERFVLLSGCSGGGKSTVLAELARRGHQVVEEPGRRIVAEELAQNGKALPWINLAAFAQRAVAVALEDRERAAALPGHVFFDRGLIDAAVALEHATGRPMVREHAAARYHQRVFVVPPWPEIYVHDPERRHGFDKAVAEYDRLLTAFTALGYEIEILPKADPVVRADFILGHLSLAHRP